MQLLTRLSAKASGIFIYPLLLIFPFSYHEVNTKMVILLILIIGYLIYLTFGNKSINPNLLLSRTILALIVMFMFDFAEKVNFIKQFSISFDTDKTIPLYTLLLSVATLGGLLYIFKEGILKHPVHEFGRYLVMSCISLVLLITVFSPILIVHYQMKMDTNLQLINTIFKYGLIFLLVSHHFVPDEQRIRSLSIGLGLSLTAVVVLSIIVE